MKTLLYLFIFLVAYKLVSNGIYYLRAKWFRQTYVEWLFSGQISMTTYKSTFRTILKRANIDDAKLPMAQLVGYGQIATGVVSVINNFPNRQEDHAIATARMIDDAIGIFRQRFFETFNPLYWIESVVFLPRTVLAYLGLNPGNVVIKFFNILWWIIGPVAILYRDKITSYISGLLP